MPRHGRLWDKAARGLNAQNWAYRRGRSAGVPGRSAGRLDAEPEGKRALWKSLATEKRLQRGDPTLMHSAEMLDIMMNPAHAKCWTGLEPEKIE